MNRKPRVAGNWGEEDRHPGRRRAGRRAGRACLVGGAARGFVLRPVRVLYSGSVKTDNANPFFERLSIDGALVGGASLQAESFSEIVHLAEA